MPLLSPHWLLDIKRRNDRHLYVLPHRVRGPRDHASWFAMVHKARDRRSSCCHRQLVSDLLQVSYHHLLIFLLTTTLRQGDIGYHISCERLRTSVIGNRL